MTINVGEFLTRRAKRDPGKECAVEPFSGRRFTFQESNERSNQVANGLTDIGVKAGDRVGLLVMNGVEFMETFFAAGKIGAVNVPLNWRLVADELEFILADAGVSVLVFSSDFAEVVAELQSRGDKTHIREWIQVGGETAGFAKDFDAWMGAQSTDEPDIGGGDDDLLFIMYTSGTTGLPKGVMHSHNTMFYALCTNVASSDFRGDDRFLNSLPMFHVGALTPVLSTVYGGLTIVILRSFDPGESWRVIDEEKITTTLMVPAMLQFMLLVRDPEVHDGSSLRWIMSGAAPVPVSLIETYQALGIEINQVYGLTETAGPACLIAGDDAVTRAGSTGRSFFHTDVRVVREDGSDVDPGESGEVLVAGPHIMLGYWNRPEATAETIREGWLHTGDVALMDKDGFVTIVDRVKDMLISGGENVYPAEIENVLMGHPQIADAGVIGVPSAKWGESPLAVVVAKEGEEVSAEDIMEFTSGKLAAFKSVKVVEFTDVIPRNASGKILKRELRDTYSDVHAPS